MSTMTANGFRVVSGSVTFPYYGTWSADLEVDATAALATAVTLVIGDLTVRGTVTRQALFAGSVRARVVGGAAGWRNVVPARGYAHDAGVKLSSVLADAARDCGESINVATDRVLGANYAREAGKAENLLALELDDEWWMDANGTTQTGPRASTPIVTPFNVIKRHGARGQIEIATEAISSWQPGRTFSSLTIPDTQTVSSVTVEATNEGKIRLQVLTADSAIDRLRSDMRSLIRAELAALTFAGEWEYTIASATSATVDVVPTDDRMPSLTRVPMRPGLMGETVTPAAGSLCRIVFVNRNPARPECVGIIGNPSSATIGDAPEPLARGPASEDIRAALAIWFGVFTSGGMVAPDFSAFKTAMATPTTNLSASLVAAAPDLQTTVVEGT